MEIVFWACGIFVLYVYFGYPALLAVYRRFASDPVKKQYWEPAVSIVIAAHNERPRIAKKLENCLALDYPKRKLQIIVSLDGPTDGTEFAVWKYAACGVELVHSKVHRGKAVALNRAMRRATGEIVVFADIRQTFDRQALRELVANFADHRVGAASGELLLLEEERGHGAQLQGREAEQEAKSDVGLYWRYEKSLRRMESEIHSVAGATGAIYAIRRELFEELPEDTLVDDMLTPLRIVLKGKRAVFDPAARAYDMVSCCPQAEYGRKVRTLAGNFQLIAQLPALLMPWRNPILLQFLSHKLGRLFVPYALVGLLFSNVFILGGLYSITFSLQAAWYLLAAAGFVISRRQTAEPVLQPEESKRAA